MKSTVNQLMCSYYKANSKKGLYTAVGLSLLLFFNNLSAQNHTVAQRVDSLMKLMTLDEKIGQLNQYSSSWATGPVSPEGNKLQEIREGKVGSLLNVKGVDKTRAMQEIALQSRLRIPLLFGLDVIHGYKTIFPIPLAEAASWDMNAIETSARIAAVETAASGIHWTFAPMVDIARDARWGRVMEGAGEDTYLGCAIARTRVKGFQGKGLGATDAVMACVKHFAAYGAAIGGRDYNSVDMSDCSLWEVYLPPFKAALDAGAATFMNSFNDLNGIPATGNSYLQRDILKGKWGFQGFVVSDWGSIGEMIQHGYVKDQYEAAQAAISAGSDMDMESRCYNRNLKQLVRDGKVSVSLINDAARRILTKKFELGLFDDPFRFSISEREIQTIADTEHRIQARDVARKSIVLLKNENGLLPLAPSKKIALIGPLAKSKVDMLGFWNVEWPDNSDVISPFEGLEARVGKGNLLYAKGCDITDTSKVGFSEAVNVARKADVVILTVGEKRDMSGEAKSRSNIHLPGIQEELIKAIYTTGKPVIVLVNAGRPLIFNWTAEHVSSIVYTWWLGSEAGNAMADVLFGDYNPSGKLPMTFPASEGQIPIYYNYLNTGRPASDDGSFANYQSGYIDLAKSPRYPFGFGLSYTSFLYDGLKLSSEHMKSNEKIEVSFSLTNTGKYAGDEVVQLYFRDQVASVVRPVKELKDFQKIHLDSGEHKTVHFTIDKEKLSFYNRKLEWVAEPGQFDLMIGASSADIRLKSTFVLE
ncbi:glycoside hydrolase family 3 N-terminal domain-containing protein [Parabacteroides sp. FAFU027]|uniref:glycoside hydrolase family 3 N-terminal domain-containing protein n=1 Tax=Parabacteroides sp. FAFU027 TaxID=2922715 RepID=UPI001FB03934|nr:glycoside hydrolase family 3 N-terminal domain-containing protein [Parabacteroides sp. FAFU027]